MFRVWTILMPRRGLYGAALAAALFLTAAALAQEEGGALGPPVKLFPRVDSEELAPIEKKVLAPAAAAEEDTAEGAAEEDGATEEEAADGEDGPVRISPLRALDPSSIGTLGPGEGGYGADLWEGSERAQIENLLPRLPVATPSPAMRSMTRRLLLTTALVPEGDARAPSLLGLRLERLAALGDVAGVTDLLGVTPPGINDPLVARVDANAGLLAGDNPGACSRIETEVAAGQTAPYWLKGLAFCRAINGEIAAARLAADLLRELGETGDDTFYTLIAALAGDESARVDSLIDPTPLHLAMLRAARQDIPADAVPGAGPGILRAIAIAPNAEISVRLLAAEQAEAVGALDPAALAQIYASVIFNPDDLINAVSIANADNGPRANALLYQVGQIQTVPAARAEAMSAAWSVARGTGGFLTAARVNHEALLGFTPTKEFAWFADDAGLALLAAGEVQSARLWFDMASEAAGQNRPEASTAWLDLWPLLQIADTERPIPWSPDIVRPWWEGQLDLPQARRQERANVMYTVFEALGYRIKNEDWLALFEGPLTVSAYMPAPAVWQGLKYAAAEGRVGETIIYALLVLGETGPSDANPVTLGAVVGALRQVGLESDARAIALEAMLARTL